MRLIRLLTATAVLIGAFAIPALAQVDCDGPAWDLSCAPPPPPSELCDVAWDLSCAPTTTTTTPAVTLPPSEGVFLPTILLIVESAPAVEAVPLVAEWKPVSAPVVWDVLIPRPAFGVHPI